jgi:hypothetical protein
MSIGFNQPLICMYLPFTWPTSSRTQSCAADLQQQGQRDRARTPDLAPVGSNVGWTKGTEPTVSMDFALPSHLVKRKQQEPPPLPQTCPCGCEPPSIRRFSRTKPCPFGAIASKSHWLLCASETRPFPAPRATWRSASPDSVADRLTMAATRPQRCDFPNAPQLTFATSRTDRDVHAP